MKRQNSFRTISRKLISILIGGVGLFIISSAGIASAATLYQDQFNRSENDDVGNGWTELEDEEDDVSIEHNALRLRSYLPGNPDAAASSSTISSVGFDNIRARFRWSASHHNENSDILYFAWALAPAPDIDVEDDWTTVGTFSHNHDGYRIANVFLGAAAANTMFNILFWTDVSKHNEGFDIDYVEITGDPIVSVVPLPAGLPLFATGLAALGFAAHRRRRRKVAQG